MVPFFQKKKPRQIPIFFASIKELKQQQHCFSRERRNHKRKLSVYEVIIVLKCFKGIPLLWVEKRRKKIKCEKFLLRLLRAKNVAWKMERKINFFEITYRQQVLTQRVWAFQRQLLQGCFRCFLFNTSQMRYRIWCWRFSSSSLEFSLNRARVCQRT